MNKGQSPLLQEILDRQFIINGYSVWLPDNGPYELVEENGKLYIKKDNLYQCVGASPKGLGQIKWIG